MNTRPPIEQQVTVNETTSPYTYAALSAISSGRHRADLIKMVLELHFRSQAAPIKSEVGHVNTKAVTTPMQTVPLPAAEAELQIGDDEFGQAFSSFFQ
jgi:hypothetical protein